MERATMLYYMAMLIGLGSSACDCEPRPLEPSLNTVDPKTHEPYQPKMPKATGNPMTASDAVPEPPRDQDDARPSTGTP